MPTIRSYDGTRISYTYHQGKQTLVFLHGWTLNQTVWRSHVRYFQKKGYGTLAIDLRGHGLSDKPIRKNKYSIGIFSRDVHAVIKALHIKNPVLIGHSLGGMIIQELLRQHTRLCDKVVLLNTTYRNPFAHVAESHPINVPLMAKHYVLTLLDDMRHTPMIKKQLTVSLRNHSEVYEFIRALRHDSPRCVLLSFLAILAFDNTKNLSRIRQKVLLLEGEHDLKTPLVDMQYMQKHIPNAQLEIIPDAKHNSMVQQPKIVRKYIEKFL